MPSPIAYLLTLVMPVFGTPTAIHEQMSSLLSDRQCLALVGFSEARSEGVAGVASVEDVVLSRVGDSRYPNTICAVVTQPGQFIDVHNWTPRTAAMRNLEAWEMSIDIADMALRGVQLSSPECRGATSFNQSPRYRGMTKLCEVGEHRFWRYPR